MQILAIPPGIAAVCALPRPKIHRFYWSHPASNTALTWRVFCYFLRNPAPIPRLVQDHPTLPTKDSLWTSCCSRSSTVWFWAACTP
ncbi:hypothetical protein FUT63_12740 [Extensimonas vulgaris]|nr:hypothetical protein FUT63_12740 [Extensimonas vulgaris]